MLNYNVCIIGGGCWGVTLGCLLLEKKCKIKIYEPLLEKFEKLRISRRLESLPQLKHIPEDIEIINDIEYGLQDAEIIVFVLPSSAFREFVRKTKPFINNDKIQLIVSATKGIENDTFMRMSEILSSETGLGDKIVVLSGPTHAEEVCQRIPTACVVSGTNKDVMSFAQNLFFTEHFRVYTNDDIIGVEFGGALKNIYAIAAGICDGLNLGDNTKAALVTRSLAELSRFGTKLGAKLITFFGLSGLGDLMVTCYSKYSRNSALGRKLAQNVPLKQALKEINMVVEGVSTVKAVYTYCERNNLNIDMPFAEEVYKIIYENKPIYESLKSLIYRTPKHETVNDFMF